MNWAKYQGLQGTLLRNVAISLDGDMLTIDPAAGFVGELKISVASSDANQHSQSETFTLTLKSPNSAPSFQEGANVSVLENAATQTIANWARNISPGQSIYDRRQSVSFSVEAADPSLFEIQPTIRPDGTLSFKPAAGHFGTTNIAVRLQDDGGTAYGGINAADETFTISIIRIVDPINDVQLMETQDSIAIDLVVGNVGGETVRFTASAVTQVQGVANQNGFAIYDANFDNWGRTEEKWIQSYDGSWFFIRPDGSLFRWDGTGTNGSELIGHPIAAFDVRYWENPNVLVDPLRAAVSLEGNRLTVDPADGFVGEITVTVRGTIASVGTQERTFRITVSSGSTGNPPE